MCGELGVILGARTLSRLQNQLELDEVGRNALLPLVGVDSETDHLPLGAEREFWHREALAEKDVDLKKAEAWCHDMVIEACSQLIRVLEDLGVRGTEG